MKLFFDHLKCKIMKEDPTLTWLRTVQNYLNTVFERSETSEEQEKRTVSNDSSTRILTCAIKSTQNLC